MSHEIREVIALGGNGRNSGAYIKIGFKWYRLDGLSEEESAEAESVIAQRTDDTLRALGLGEKA